MIKILISILFCMSLILTGCATSVDAFYAARADQYSVKTIYLVSNNSENHPNMDEIIRKDLNKRGINVMVGPEVSKVTTEDAIMKYNETWNAELASSITALDIILFSKNGEVVASSHWKNSKFSTLATMSSIVNDAVEIIFEKVQIQP